MASGSFTLGPGEGTGGRKRCQSRHGQRVTLQCQERIPEGAYHTDHWALDTNGATVRWDDLVAMYPAIDDSFVANPQRIMVGEPGPEVVGNGSARLNQVGGEHYRKFKIQPWDVVDEYGLSFYAGNALKYLLRAGHKGAALEDLKKCRHYLDKLIETEEGRNDA